MINEEAKRIVAEITFEGLARFPSYIQNEAIQAISGRGWHEFDYRGGRFRIESLKYKMEQDEREMRNSRS